MSTAATGAVTRALDAGRRPFGAGLACAIVHALCFGALFPPFSMTALAWVALVPLVVLALDTRHPWRSASAVWLATMPVYLYHHLWMVSVTAVGLPALAVALALFPALFVVIISFAARRFGAGSLWIGAPVLWTAIEFLRGEVAFDGYPWFHIGHSQTYGAMFDVAALLGVYGVSFLVGVANTGLALTLRRLAERGRNAPIPFARAAIIVLGVMGAARLAFPPAPQETSIVRVAIVQTNVPQSNKIAWDLEQRIEDFGDMVELTAEAVEGDQRPDVIIWPETMFPGYTLAPEALATARDEGAAQSRYGHYLVGFADQLIELHRIIGIPMLVGAIGVDAFEFNPSGDDPPWTQEHIYNSVFLIENGQINERRYDKLRLTPFGEVMPYISAFDWLEEALLAFGARGMTFDLSAGSEPVVLETDGTRMATPICFESTVAEVCRRLTHPPGEPPANLLVNVTNDGWFGASDAGRRHHLILGRWRCAELGVPMIRAANTGISCYIDARGRVIAEAEPRRATTRVWPVRIAEDPPATVFARSGNAFGWLNAAAGAVLVGLILRPGRGSRFKSQPPPMPTNR